MLTHARHENLFILRRIRRSDAPDPSIATVPRPESSDVDDRATTPIASLVEQVHSDTPLPRRARAQVAASRDWVSAEVIATRLQELVAIQRFLHARDAKR
jgi:hypothetical protein